MKVWHSKDIFSGGIFVKKRKTEKPQVVLIFGHACQKLTDELVQVHQTNTFITKIYITR